MFRWRRAAGWQKDNHFKESLEGQPETGEIKSKLKAAKREELMKMDSRQVLVNHGRSVLADGQNRWRYWYK